MWEIRQRSSQGDRITRSRKTLKISMVKKRKTTSKSLASYPTCFLSHLSLTVFHEHLTGRCSTFLWCISFTLTMVYVCMIFDDSGSYWITELVYHLLTSLKFHLLSLLIVLSFAIFFIRLSWQQKENEIFLQNLPFCHPDEVMVCLWLLIVTTFVKHLPQGHV